MDQSKDRKKNQNTSLDSQKERKTGKRNIGNKVTGKKSIGNKATGTKNIGNKATEKKSTGNKTTGKAPVCPYQKKCGGCQYTHLPYKKQLEEKQKTVTKLLGSFGKVRPILGMDEPWHYRNKVHGVVCTDRQGNGYTGIYEEGSHRVVRVDSCRIEDQKADEIMQSVAGLMRSFKMKAYNEDTGRGFLRHILIRTGHQTGQILLVLVTASPVFPSKNNFVKAIRKLHPEITSIVQNVNDRYTSMVLGEKQKVLYGKGYIEDVLCGKRFRISPKSFYQINPIQTEKLYNTAIEYAGLTGKETVIDAYSGIGTIGMIASDQAGKVISVELNGEAVRDSIANAKRNHIDNMEFYKADAGEFMVKMAAQHQKADVVFMDPPRAGSDRRFLDSLLRLRPKRVVYISCNPETQQRDLKYLTGNGYRVQKIQPVDMFPMTDNIETVCLLSKNK